MNPYKAKRAHHTDNILSATFERKSKPFVLYNINRLW